MFRSAWAILCVFQPKPSGQWSNLLKQYNNKLNTSKNNYTEHLETLDDVNKCNNGGFFCKKAKRTERKNTVHHRSGHNRVLWLVVSILNWQTIRRWLGCHCVRSILMLCVCVCARARDFGMCACVCGTVSALLRPFIQFCWMAPTLKFIFASLGVCTLVFMIRRMDWKSSWR